MRIIQVPVHAIQSMAFAIKKYPLHYPKRMKHIAEFVSARSIEINLGATPTILIGKSRGKTIAASCMYDDSLTHSRELFHYVMSHPELLLDIHDFAEQFYLSGTAQEIGHHEIILLPPSKDCNFCEYHLEIETRASYPIVYTRDGAKVAACFAGRCKECHVAYQHSYHTFGNECKITFEDGHGNRVFEKNTDSNYLQISNATAFEVAYLQQVHYSIVFSGVTFDAAAAAYNAIHGKVDMKRLQQLQAKGRRVGSNSVSVWTLNSQRLEEAWFIWRINIRVCIRFL